MMSEWTEYATGGGCMALLRTEDDGRYWLLTDWLDPHLPVQGNPAALGVYDKDGQSLALWKVPAFTTPEAAFGRPEEWELMNTRQELE